VSSATQKGSETTHDRNAIAARLIGTAPPRDNASFDYLVGAGEDRLRNGEAERLRRLEVDDQLELSGLLDGEV
jgi:hypothetical protein